MIKKLYALMVFASFAFVNLAYSETNSALVAVPGKAVCKQQDIKLKDQSAKAELCVKQGSFAHDEYAVKLNGNIVLRGIDDQTTKGITGTYQGEELLLQCAPELRAPEDPSPEKIDAYQKIMPKLSREEAKKMAIQIETIEIGRLCVLKKGSQELMKTIVQFR